MSIFETDADTVVDTAFAEVFPQSFTALGTEPKAGKRLDFLDDKGADNTWGDADSPVFRHVIAIHGTPP